MSKLNGSILITGASSGLGLAMASQVASGPLGQDYHSIYVVRDTNARDLNALRDRHPAHKSDIFELDLASLTKVRAVASAINKRVAEGSLPPIRALILNAGFQESSELNMSEDGFEMTFQVNYLSQFLLALLLLQSMDKQHGRILVLSSPSHNPSAPNSALGIMAGAYKGEWNTLFTKTELLAKGKWSTPQEAGDAPVYHAGYRRYGASKLCVVMLMYELQNRLSRDPQLSNISVLGLDPGAMPTNLMRHANWWNRTTIMKIAIPLMAPMATKLQPNGDLRTTSKSAADALRACFDTETLGAHPKAVYLNGTEEKQPSPEATDEKKREMLWKDSIAYVRLQEGETALKNWR